MCQKDTHFIEHANSNPASYAILSSSHTVLSRCGVCLQPSQACQPRGRHLSTAHPSPYHPSVHWALPDVPCSVKNEEGMRRIIQEGEEKSIQWAICHMSHNTWLCPGEEQTSAEGSSSGLLTAWFLCNNLFQLIQVMGWVKASLSLSCVPFTLHGSFASCACSQECLFLVCWLLKCWEMLPECCLWQWSCQPLRCCNALYCDEPLKLHKTSAAEQLLKTPAHRSHSISAL